MADDLSFVCGSTSEPLLYRTVDGVLKVAALHWPERTALAVRHQRRRYTFRELDAAVERVARGMVSLGLQRGERIAILSPNNTEWVLTMFAAARAGLILVNINPAYRLNELAFILRQVGARALVVAPTFKSSDYLAMLSELVPELRHSIPGQLASERLPDLRMVIQLGETAMPGYWSFAELETAGDVLVTCSDTSAIHLDPDLPYNIQFTSGTTGLPKGATLTHFNLVNNGFFVGEGLGLTAEDSVCIPVPLYHCFGMVLGLLAAMTHGAASIFPSEGFDAFSVLETVAQERCTVLHGVPTMFIAELDHPRFRDFDLSSLRTGIMAGAPCPIAIMNRVVEGMHMHGVTICYGMTETSPVSFQSSPSDALELRVRSVGRVHPHVQVKIIDDDGRTVPRGVAGELCTRGYSVMLGYWDEPERTREVLDAAGWLHTGDLATLDSAGYCTIVGRVKDMIIRGGENISPREIEEYLFRHPAVLDVAVVGVPDARYGEEVCACIRVREGAVVNAQEVREFCRGQIAHFKIPRYVRFVAAFPLTANGKVQKYQLREHMRIEIKLLKEADA